MYTYIVIYIYTYIHIKLKGEKEGERESSAALRAALIHPAQPTACNVRGVHSACIEYNVHIVAHRLGSPRHGNTQRQYMSYHSTGTHVLREQHMFACSTQATKPKLNIHVNWGNDLRPDCKTRLRSSGAPSIHSVISCAKTVNNRTVFKPRDILETTRLTSNLRLRVQGPEA